MKKENLLKITIVLTILNTLAVIYLICRPFTVELRHVSEVIPLVKPSDIYLPDTFYLAKERVPLERKDISEAFRKELIVNTYLHSHTIQVLKNAHRYFPIIEPILKEENIPDDFKYLAVIESSLNPLAISPVGAVGIWQFMKETAKEYGLKISPEVDERYHIEKATRAACKYLKKARNKFGSWTLAAASYNGGMNMINKQMNIQKENTYYDLLLGEETGRYVFRMMALKQIIENPLTYDFFVDEYYEPEELEQIKITRTIKDLAAFAQESGINYKTLKRFNPWLRKNTLKVGKGETYFVSIPFDKKAYK